MDFMEVGGLEPPQPPMWIRHWFRYTFNHFHFCFSKFQAKFKLTLEVPSELVALSNMPVADQTIAGPIKTVHYEKSPLMSTYLVAIVVGLFDYIEGVTSEGISSIWCQYFNILRFSVVVFSLLLCPFS